jgi:biopolymer transport protein ExbD
MRANKINRLQSPQLDMNPMVDMAFLLVTFFLLATTFKVPEPAIVVLPRAVISEQLPEDELITITVAYDGRTFISMSDALRRGQWLESFTSLYGVSLSARQRDNFVMLSGIGVPAEELPQLLDLPAAERNRYLQAGLPVDSAQNQLADWLVLARVMMPRARVAIKSDRDTPYRHVDKVIQTLTANNVLRFNLITESKRPHD